METTGAYRRLRPRTTAGMLQQAAARAVNLVAASGNLICAEGTEKIQV